MKKRRFIFVILLTFLLEAAVVFKFMGGNAEASQDVMAVNKIVKTVEQNWERLAASPEYAESHSDPERAQSSQASSGSLDYTVIDLQGKVLYKTREHLSETISQAVSHRDTILEVEKSGAAVGKVIIYNSQAADAAAGKRRAALGLMLLLLIQSLCLAGFAAGLYGTLVKPFRKLEGFAERIAGGNLDIPLEMDRQNLFGAFTESFDLMRAELKKARLAEAEANAGKKELVAKLSHDIKTPVASIKAASEVGFALAESERMRENYRQIIQKADQINSLVTNLFTATLKELKELTVTSEDMESSEIKRLLENADYLHRALIPAIPPCLVLADRLRLQQVFDNIFANSYKYADTSVWVRAEKAGGLLTVELEDNGGGLPVEEIFFIKEKFRRGSNAKAVEGAGLGLFISDCFMEAMNGALTVENGERGLKVRVSVPLSGGILSNKSS